MSTICLHSRHRYCQIQKTQEKFSILGKFYYEIKKMAKIVESLKLDRLYPNYSSRPKSVGKISVYTVFWASFDPLPLVYVLFTQPLWRYEGLQLSICTNHTAGNTLNLQQERDIQIFSTQSGSQATCKLLDTCKYYLYKPDTCKPLTTTTLTIPHNLYVSVKLTSLYCGLRLILVYPNPQKREADLTLTYRLWGIVWIVLMSPFS